jgi:predicted 3-demethylubiquinone-9 3-methyltransferase (glyoxalase superfamily)
VKHAFSFTPSISLFIECESEAEFDMAFGKLSTDGGVLMPGAITALAGNLDESPIVTECPGSST